MKNCLVTGATGFVGKRLVERLIKDKINVYGVSKVEHQHTIKLLHIICDLEKNEIQLMF